QQQKPQKSVADIQKTKMEHTAKQQKSNCTIKLSDKAALNEFDQKQAVFETMIASGSFNNHPKHMTLYHALMESTLPDEDAMDQERVLDSRTAGVEVVASVVVGVGIDKLYLSSTSSMVFCDDDDILCLQELRADDSRAAPSKAPLPIDCSQTREGTLENLLIWERNRQNNTATFHCKVMIENFRTKKRYKLKVVVADDTPHTVVVMFNDTAMELLKCSAESLMGTEDEKSDAKDEHALEDSDVDEVSGPQENTGNSNAKVAVDTQKKRKRYIHDGSEST
nr:hypothetical protein [Tanacetum cinerariifolium]